MELIPFTRYRKRNSLRRSAVGAIGILVVLLMTLSACDNPFSSTGTRLSKSQMLDQLQGWVGLTYPGAIFIRKKSSCPSDPDLNIWVGQCTLTTQIPGQYERTVKTKVWVINSQNPIPVFHLVDPSFDPGPPAL